MLLVATDFVVDAQHLKFFIFFSKLGHRGLVRRRHSGGKRQSALASLRRWPTHSNALCLRVAAYCRQEFKRQ
jgi:hypothetical protein